MIKATKQKFMKIISFLLVIAMLLPTFSTLPAFADTLDEATIDAVEDWKSVANAGDWGKAIFQDRLAWNRFHK